MHGNMTSYNNNCKHTPTGTLYILYLATEYHTCRCTVRIMYMIQLVSHMLVSRSPYVVDVRYVYTVSCRWHPSCINSLLPPLLTIGWKRISTNLHCTWVAMLVQCKVLQLYSIQVWRATVTSTFVRRYVRTERPSCAAVLALIAEFSGRIWFRAGSEDWYECSAIVVIVYVCKWRCSPTWQNLSQQPGEVHCSICSCAAVAGCCVC